MINNLKNAAILLLAVLLLGVTAWALYQKKQKEKAEGQTAGTRQIVKQAATIINRYIDTQGRSHAVIAAGANTLAANWYKNGTAISGGLIDTVAEALGIAKQQLQQVTQIATRTEAARLKAEKTTDSLQRLTYFYQDKYLQLAYRPAKPGDTTDNGQFDFRYNDSLNVTQYYKKSWLLGAKKSYIDIYSNDGRTTVNSVKRLVVEQQQPAFGLRLQAIANYNLHNRLINAGPAIEVNFNRLSLTGSYYYDRDGQAFRPVLGARYDLIRF